MPRHVVSSLLTTCVALLVLSSTMPAQTLLTTEFSGTVATDFDAACGAPGDLEQCFGGVPRSVGVNGFNATYSANYTFASLGRLNTGFGTNGDWYTRDGVSTNSLSNTNVVSLTFTSLLSHIGAYMNYEPNATATPLLQAYDAMDQLIASFALDVEAPISTPGVRDAALFRGIEYAGGIRRLELSGSNLAAMDFVVRQAATEVPEPSAMLLLLVALAPLWLRAQKRRA